MDKLKERSIKVLRFLEQYTKTDMLYLAKGGFWLGMGQIVATGSALVTSIAFANLLSPETYGLYKYILSINSLLLVTTLSGMDSAVTQAVSRGFDGTLIPGTKAKIKWGLLGSAVALGVGLYYFLQGNSTLAIAFSILSFFVPFTESFDMYNSFLWGKKLFNIQTLYNISKKCLLLVTMLLTLFLTKNLYIILTVYFLSITLPSILLLFRTQKFYKNNDNIDKDAVSYGKSLSLAYIINLLAAELDKILIFHYLGAANLAIYSLAVAPNDQIKGLMKNINSLAMPQFSQRTPEEIKKTVWRKVWILGGITSLCVIAYIILAPFFFSLFFPKYLSSIYYSQVLSLSLIPVVMAGFMYTILESQKNERGIYSYNLYGNIFSIVLLAPFIYYFGIWGAVGSRLVSRLFYFGLATNLVKKIS